MATEMIVKLVDDLDGSVADETLRFSLDGSDYEIDLNAKNATALRKALEKFIGAARKESRASARTARRPTRRTSGYDAQAIRVWAEENKVKVSSRGRISADIVAQYEAAGGK